VGAAGGRRSQRGSIALLLLVALAVTVGSIAIANSSSNTLLRSAFQSQSREAREAALAGIDTTISELNRVENRKLLVTKQPLGAWNNTLVNPCLVGDPPDPSVPVPSPTAAALNLKNGAWQNAGGDANRQYRVVSIQKIATKTRTDANSTFSRPADTNIATLPGTYDPEQISIVGTENNVGYIRLTVEGKLLRNGNQVSNTTVTREFEVVPKCCNQSFGLPKDVSGSGVHGVDVRLCDGGTPGGGGVGDGLRFGFNGGSLTTAGSAGELLTVNNKGATVPIDAIVCVQNEATGQTAHCNPYNSPFSVSTKQGNIPVANINAVVPLPTFPGTATTGYTVNDTLCLKSTATGVMAYANSNCITNPIANFNKDYCASANSQNHCLIESITLSGNKTITTDTTDRKLNLYITKDTKFTGNGGLNHVRNGAGISTNSDCATNGSSYVNNLSIYGSSNPNSNQILNLRGTTGLLGFSLFAPNSTVSLNGGGGAVNICGKVWTKNLDYNGSVTFITPPSGGVDNDGDGIDDNFAARWDWIARSVWGTRLF
jgi:hypothetical protein